MRPINKGVSPYDKISDYSDALPFLEEKIGLYCSYCEFCINHVPEVEHVISKSESGDKTAWGNLLLGCKYCNTRKSKKTTLYNADEYLWPDIYNTAIAFSYDQGIPRVNEEVAMQLDPSGCFLNKAKKLFDLVDLGHRPVGKSKDRRFKQRNEAYRLAKNSLKAWQAIDNKEDKAAKFFLSQTIELAKNTGFFSIWTMVFYNDSDVLHALISAFPGTERTYFDQDGHPRFITK